MSPPPFEILIPVRNGGPLLAECIESILAQSDEDFTVTVIDNASTDATPAIVAGFSDARLSYRRFDEGVGLSANFNRCLGLARAPLFALVHADDRLRPDFVRHMKAAAAAHPEAWLCFCRGDLIDTQGRGFTTLKQRWKTRSFRRRGPVLGGMRGLRQLASYNHLMAPCAVYRRALLPADLRFDEAFHYLTDQTFWISTLLRGGAIAQTDAALYEHRVHRGQLSSTLRSSAATLGEIGLFEPHIRAALPEAQARALIAVWRRYGRLLRLRNMARHLLRGDIRAIAAQLALRDGARPR